MTPESYATDLAQGKLHLNCVTEQSPASGQFWCVMIPGTVVGGAASASLRRVPAGSLPEWSLLGGLVQLQGMLRGGGGVREGGGGETEGWGRSLSLAAPALSRNPWVAV